MDITSIVINVTAVCSGLDIRRKKMLKNKKFSAYSNSSFLTAMYYGIILDTVLN